ncbi:MAG: hypothetical protein QOH55_1684 [Microbacteriaceae bacterium]|nr:hypothetical protein [Microbacteriaceae bacterium]
MPPTRAAEPNPQGDKWVGSRDSSVGVGTLGCTTVGRGYSSGDVPLYDESHDRSESGRCPLLLIHGGGSTIESNWGRLIPELSRSRPVWAVELQGHGRTAPSHRTQSFEASADDVARLLDEIDVGAVDVLGFSNGGQVAMQLARAQTGHRAASYRRLGPFRRDGMIDGFWEGLETASFEDMPAVYRSADLQVSGDPAHARSMFELDKQLMLSFTDWRDAIPALITAQTLVVAGDRDVITPQHAVRLAATIPDDLLLIVPGTHGSYLGELAAAGNDLLPMRATLPFLTEFLDA